MVNDKGVKLQLTLSVRHAVEEDPVPAAGAVSDEGHVVAGLDAEHGKQLQPVSGQSVPTPVTQVTCRNVHRRAVVCAALRMRVHLQRHTSTVEADPSLILSASLLKHFNPSCSFFLFFFLNHPWIFEGPE